jgi:hypothetical protein
MAPAELGPTDGIDFSMTPLEQQRAPLFVIGPTGRADAQKAEIVLLGAPAWQGMTLELVHHDPLDLARRVRHSAPHRDDPVAGGGSCQ